MIDIEIIKREIDSLEELACNIEENTVKLLEETPLIYNPVSGPFPKNNWQTLADYQKASQRDTIRKYQSYYSRGMKFIKEFQPEREGEFCECYESKDNLGKEGIMDFLQFRRSQYKNNKDEIVEKFVNRFEIQRSLLFSVPDVVKISEIKLREIISGDYIDREIEQSEYLYEKGFERAAGALAGVALEQYLRIQCDKYKIEYKKKDTIEPLLQKLCAKNIIDPTLKTEIQHLASIRNSCAHATDIDKGRVKELIERVKKIT